MAKTFTIAATLPAEITAFGTVREWDIEDTGEFATGTDINGEVDAEASMMKKKVLTMSGEVLDASSAPAFGSTFSFNSITWTVDSVKYGERNKEAGPFELTAHKWANI